MKIVRTLAKGTITLSVFPILSGIFFFFFWSRHDYIVLLAPVSVVGVGVLAFVSGWSLYKNQSHSAAVFLTVLTGFGAILSLCAISLPFKYQPQPDLSLVGFLCFWAFLNFLFFWVSYKGMKATKLIEKIHSEKIVI